MKIICPDCMASLNIIDGKNARCRPECGGTFKILFSRKPLVPDTPEIEAVAPVADLKLGGKMCTNHPAVSAFTSCNRCHIPICKTCAFTLREGYNLCPACASSGDQTMSPKRRKNMLWSFVFAGISTLFFIAFWIAMAAVQTEAEAEGAATIIGMFILITGVVGMGYGFSAIDKRLHNPVSLWMATIWNIVLVAIYILLCVVGILIS